MACLHGINPEHLFFINSVYLRIFFLSEAISMHSARVPVAEEVLFDFI